MIKIHGHGRRLRADVHTPSSSNQDVHTHVARNRPSDIVALIALTVEYLATRTREIVSNYFKGEHVAYTLSPGTICHAA